MRHELELIGAKVERVTEKAILVTVQKESPLSSLNGGTAKVWFPKSQCVVRDDGTVIASLWIVEQKENEVGYIETRNA